MHMLRNFTLFALALSCTQVHAGPRELGRDYRILRSNYDMISTIERKCPNLESIEVVKRQTVEELMQSKLGSEHFNKFYIDLSKSDLKINAIKTVNALFETIEGCQDPKLAAAIAKIEEVHETTFERFKAEEPLVAPQNVPVPIRRKE